MLRWITWWIPCRSVGERAKSKRSGPGAWLYGLTLVGVDVHDLHSRGSKLGAWRICTLHPGKLTWNLKLEVWKMIFLFKQVIFRFHVSFRRCKFIFRNKFTYKIMVVFEFGSSRFKLKLLTIDMFRNMCLFSKGSTVIQ